MLQRNEALAGGDVEVIKAFLFKMSVCWWKKNTMTQEMIEYKAQMDELAFCRQFMK